MINFQSKQIQKRTFSFATPKVASIFSKPDKYFDNRPKFFKFIEKILEIIDRLGAFLDSYLVIQALSSV